MRYVILPLTVAVAWAASQSAGRTASRRWEEERRLTDQIAAMLRSIDPTVLWEEVTDVAELRVLIEELIDAVVVYPDHLQVEVNGAPPLKVSLTEVGLRPLLVRDPACRRGDLNPHPLAWTRPST